MAEATGCDTRCRSAPEPSDGKRLSLVRAYGLWREAVTRTVAGATAKRSTGHCKPEDEANAWPIAGRVGSGSRSRRFTLPRCGRRNGNETLAALPYNA